MPGPSAVQCPLHLISTPATLPLHTSLQAWDTLAGAFERTILQTHRSKFVQFVVSAQGAFLLSLRTLLASL